ncbi:MAG TPA: DNA-formamidopyrimidine glycosylase family protein [Candidatus Dormibacteraeota bacterium]
MPEGDTIWRTANALRPRLVGKPLLEVTPEPFRKLEGATVTAVEANGKHLLIRFDSGLVLHTHMRMTGAWHLYRPGEAWRKPARLAKVVLKNVDTVAVLFSAPVVELVREREAVRDLAHLGPDILSGGTSPLSAVLGEASARPTSLAPEFDLDEVLRRARASERLTLGELLLDQTVCAGIGNIYRCESLWRLRRDPWQPPAELSDNELSKVYREARRMMLDAIHGRFRPAVHGKTGRSCPRCDGRIACRHQGDPPRFVYFCPTCQRVSLQ